MKKIVLTKEILDLPVNKHLNFKEGEYEYKTNQIDCSTLTPPVGMIGEYIEINGKCVFVQAG